MQEVMLQHGIIVSHEAIRQWCSQFGHTYANGLRRRHPGDKWHIDKLGRCSGATSGSAFGGAPSIAVSEQPGGELTSTDPGAGTSDDEVHLGRACATVPVRVQWDIVALSTVRHPVMFLSTHLVIYRSARRTA